MSLSLGDLQLHIEFRHHVPFRMNVQLCKAHKLSKTDIILLFFSFSAFFLGSFCITFKYFFKILIEKIFCLNSAISNDSHVGEILAWIVAYHAIVVERKETQWYCTLENYPSSLSIIQWTTSFPQSATIKLYYRMLQQSVSPEPILWCLWKPSLFIISSKHLYSFRTSWKSSFK